MSDGKRFATQVAVVDAEAISRAVDSLAPLLGGRVICLVCVDAQGDVFVAPKPGNESTVLRYLATVDWRGAQLEFSEWFT